MNRNELISTIASSTELSKKDVAIFMDAYETAIVNAIRSGDTVSLYGFMKIERKEKKEYLGHGFGTKDRSIVPAHDYVKIRPGNALTDCVK